MIEAAVQATLDAVAAAMADEPDDWWIIGSAAVALHGADTEIADIDVLTSAAAARRIGARLGIEPIARPSDRFQSTVFLSLVGWPLSVEVMGDLALAIGGSWLPIRPVTRMRIGTIYVPSRIELVEILHRFGREKDHMRAVALGAHS
ncbi:hypothetical protein [Sphingomonas bacterium]|uniref:hypothetical protein n=1 Tax=Sphingomonas bacterium TaxID=1895847 RepID=UPI001575ECC0|nr:hypothetical protein [Sphingomonas bacterium]